MKMYHTNNPREGYENEAFELRENPGYSYWDYTNGRVRANGICQVSPADNSNQEGRCLQKVAQSSQPISSKREDFNFKEHGGQFRVHKDSYINTETQALVTYFHNLSGFDDKNDKVDLRFIDDLIEAGADINAKDGRGQTILHEVARCWHTNVATFLIDRGADVKSVDRNFRRPLHIALGVNYVDMVGILYKSELLMTESDSMKLDNCNRKRREDFDIKDNALEKPKGEGAKGGQLDDSHINNVSGREETRTLMAYFCHLATSTKEDEEVNLFYVQCLLRHHADINVQDQHGQAIMHEVARCWHTDIAKFLIDRGADVKIADKTGRQPLHVAAAVNYVAMVELLLEKGAEIDARAGENGYTPLAFAASNDACDVLSLLHQRGADIHLRGPKGRTALMAAAIADRSEASKLLLSLGARADVVDDNGEPCIVTMLAKMPTVAPIGLNQFHKIDSANRQQFFHLEHVEPRKASYISIAGDDVPKPDENDKGRLNSCTRTPLQIIVRFRQHENVEQEVIQKLLEVMWIMFGRRAALTEFLFDIVYILLWSALAVIKPDARACYHIPGDVWRIILWIVAILFTLYLIFQELLDFANSKKKLDAWKVWKLNIIEDDFKDCHPRWPLERKWLKKEKEEVESVKPSYFHNYWNIFDWCVYIFLINCVVFHVIDFFIVSDELCWPEDNTNATSPTVATTGIENGDKSELESWASRIHIRLFAITIIFVWLRLLKSARAFKSLGPFIVMCHNIIGDVAKFCFLYFIVYIPYTCSFWMMFGGDVEEFETVSETLFSLFRMTLVDEYNYEGLKEENPVMCDILVGTYLAISAIVMLNFFIAMLSETFVRIHDNASSNALMERAAILSCLHDNLSDEKKLAYYELVKKPMKAYYDDDMALERKDNDVKKITFQIKDQMASLVETINKKGLNRGEEQKHEQQLREMHRINQEFISLKAQNERAMASIHEILDILKGQSRLRSTKSVHVRAGEGTFHGRRGVND